MKKEVEHNSLYSNVKVLDCTLRDGGYINNWNFGKNVIKNIVHDLVNAKTDYIELGFLRNEEYDENRSVFNSINQIKKLVPNDAIISKFVGMILYTDYDISKLEENDGVIDMLRITFHKYDYLDGIKYCRQVIDKGYKVFINPINITGYSDGELLALINEVNDIKPYGFSIVDTFGALTKEDLFRIYYIIENNLDSSIVIGLHLHENLSMSLLLAQSFLEVKKPTRSCIIDGSLYGIGRNPGNLCIELIMNHMINYYDKNYSLEYVLDAIDNYIEPIKENSKWGYSKEYYLSGKNKVHRNYAEYFSKKGRLTARGLNNLLQKISIANKDKFDEKYAELIYREYMNYRVDDSITYKEIKTKIEGKKVILIAPGPSSSEAQNIISKFNEQYIVFSLNFIPTSINIDYVFFSNIKRYKEYLLYLEERRLIVTSNILREENVNGLIINYESLMEPTYVDSCGILLLRLLIKIGIKEVYLIGFDGFNNDKNYVEDHYGKIVNGRDDTEKIIIEYERIKSLINVVYF